MPIKKKMQPYLYSKNFFIYLTDFNEIIEY